MLKHVVLGLLMAAMLAGCGGGSESGTPPTSSAAAPSADAASTPTQTAPGTGNQAPTISGNPPATDTAGTAYSFQPTASDPNGNALTFSIQNKPSWASFSTSSGNLSGTPAAADAGTASNIVISVSDGTSQASLPGFSITVNAAPAASATGAATISWTPPAQNSDGSALTDLAGFHIYYGTSSDNLTQVIDVKGTGLTAYTITALSPATWYFAVAAYNSAGAESGLSNVGNKTIL